MCEDRCVDGEARSAIRGFAEFLHEKDGHPEYDRSDVGPPCAVGLCLEVWYMNQ